MELTFTKTAHDDLASFLDECQSSLGTLEKLKNSRSVLGCLIGACKDDFSYLKEDLKAIVDNCSFNKEHIVRGLYLKAYASFENFFRQLICAIVDEINRCEDGCLKSEVNERYIRYAGKILANFKTPLDIGVHDPMKVLQSALSVVNDARNWDGEVMNYNITSINMERIVDILKRVSVKINWLDDVIEYRKEELEKVLGTVGKKNVENEIESFLKKSLRNRNRIAHLGHTASDVEDQDLKDLIDVLKLISIGQWHLNKTVNREIIC